MCCPLFTKLDAIDDQSLHRNIFEIVCVTEKPLHVRSGLMFRNMRCQLFTKLDSIDCQSFPCEVWGCLYDGEATPHLALRSYVQGHLVPVIQETGF